MHGPLNVKFRYFGHFLAAGFCTFLHGFDFAFLVFHTCKKIRSRLSWSLGGGVCLAAPLLCHY